MLKLTLGYNFDISALFSENDVWECTHIYGIFDKVKLSSFHFLYTKIFDKVRLSSILLSLHSIFKSIST